MSKNFRGNILYGPKGAAGEYAPLALNVAVGCVHKCQYCYGPGCTRRTLERWDEVRLVKNVLERLENDCKKMQGDEREVFLSFLTDCYATDEVAAMTRAALLILEEYKMKATVLTKAGERARQDFDIFKRNNWAFGSTIIFMSESFREKWEPGAPSIQSRIDAVKEAHRQGIRTWISLEPVVDADEALQVVRELKPYVWQWKVGKLNHRKSDINWTAFLRDVELELAGCNYIIKRDLEAFRRS